MDFNFLFALSRIHFAKKGLCFRRDSSMFPLTRTLIGRMNTTRIDATGLSGANREAQIGSQKAC